LKDKEYKPILEEIKGQIKKLVCQILTSKEREKLAKEK